MGFKKWYMDFSQDLFHLVTGGTLKDKEMLLNDKLTYWVVLSLKFIFMWILFPLFIFLPLIAFFFSISFAFFFALIYILLVFVFLVLKIWKKLIK